MIARGIFAMCWVLVLIFLALPILVVVALSFSSASYLTFPPPAFGIRWYRAYLGSQEWLDSTWLSLAVAACVVVLATVLGTLAALGLRRLPRSFRQTAPWSAAWFSNLPYAVADRVLSL